MECFWYMYYLHHTWLEGTSLLNSLCTLHTSISFIGSFLQKLKDNVFYAIDAVYGDNTEQLFFFIIPLGTFLCKITTKKLAIIYNSEIQNVDC